AERLTLGASYEVALATGLPGLNGGQTRNAWSSIFQVVTQPGIARTVPPAGSTNAARYGIRIDVLTPMNRDSVEDRVRVSAVDSHAVSMFWGNDLTLSVNVSLKASTGYTVDIADGAIDRYGQPLGPQRIRFSTGAIDPSVSFAIPSSIGTYSASTEPVLYYHA